MNGNQNSPTAGATLHTGSLVLEPPALLPLLCTVSYRWLPLATTRTSHRTPRYLVLQYVSTCIAQSTSSRFLA